MPDSNIWRNFKRICFKYFLNSFPELVIRGGFLVYSDMGIFRPCFALPKHLRRLVEKLNGNLFWQAGGPGSLASGGDFEGGCFDGFFWIGAQGWVGVLAKGFSG